MANHEQFGDLFANAATGFSITDHQGNVLEANASLGSMVDRTAAELQSLNLFDLTHPDDQSRHRKLIDELLAGDIPGFVIEKRYVRPDGTHAWVRNSVSLVAGEARPKPQRIVCLSEDISASKRAQQVLERQEQLAAMGRLTSSIMHEINNPLEAVLNLIYLARHTKDANEAQAYLKNAEEELGRAGEITMQGLQFHRQGSSITSSNVADIMQTVLALFKARMRIGEVKLEYSKEDAPELLCFAGEIRQVFVNLISNAIEAMQNGGRLRVRLRPATDWRSGENGVRITIADTGSGISRETRSRMYEAFYTTKGAGGSGLGLWVTANIVRKHRGVVHVRSKERGTGTVFMLIFPYLGAEGQAAGFQDAA